MAYIKMTRPAVVITPEPSKLNTPRISPVKKTAELPRVKPLILSLPARRPVARARKVINTGSLKIL